MIVTRTDRRRGEVTPMTLNEAIRAIYLEGGTCRKDIPEFTKEVIAILKANKVFCTYYARYIPSPNHVSGNTTCE